MARSNAVNFRVIDTPPLEGVGWEVRVVSYEGFEERRNSGGHGQPIAIIPKFHEVWVSPEIGGTGEGTGDGAGAVTLDLDAAFWSTTLPTGEPGLALLEYEHLWQVFEEGSLRFEFISRDLSFAVVPADNGLIRTVTVSGPSGIAVLAWGCVMTPNYPNKATDPLNGTYVFKRTPLMSAWLQLLAASQRRGTLDGFIRPTFTHTHDSAGELWEDTPPVIDPATASAVLSADVNFASDSYTLTTAGLATLDTICARFATHTAPNVTCVGHTDSTNTVPYNQTLSENRANAVRTAILARVPQAVVTATGKGELQPIATNATSAGRAKNRRVTITYPTIDATAYETTVEPPLGMDLLKLLKEWSGEDRDQPSPIRVEYRMRPGFNLDVQRQFGSRRERQVVFYEGSTHTMAKQWERNRASIANLVAVQNDDGEYSVATSTASIARWRQRELFVRENNSFEQPARAAIASSLLELRQDETATLTMKVPPYAPGRRVFRDYDLGDWVGVSRYRGGTTNVVEAYRVLALTLKVDANNNVDLELTLQNTAAAYAQRLQARITSLRYHLDKGTTTWISDTEPVTARVGDLWTPRTPGSL